MILSFKNVPKELEFALLEAKNRLQFELGEAKTIQIQKIEKGIKVEKDLICYSSVSNFLRALTIFLSNQTAEEVCAFAEMGIMLDLSRNAVTTVETIKDYAFSLACMGYNQFKLYTEDTFIVKNQPYFGYMRGALTSEEIKSADSYCASVGIELIPCVQTLAHLNQITRYDEYGLMVDFGDILLADDDRTYKLIDDIFATLAQNYTTRKVNIGMDEAHMLGLGKYLDKHGYTARFDIMIKHLNRVLEIADKYGFKCEMWSDMFFRLLNNGDYYGKTSSKIPQEVLDNLPKNVQLIYWDYYSCDFDHYQDMFKKHLLLTKNIGFASGAWKWSGFAPCNTFSIAANTQNIKSSILNGIQNYFVTCWGDNGAEASHFSVLPTLYDAAQKAYSSTDYSSFSLICGISFSEYMLIDTVNHLTEKSKTKITNPVKYMLYNDVLQGYFDEFCVNTSETFSKIHTQIDAIAKKDFKYNYVFATLSALTKALIHKSELGLKIKTAYDNKNLAELKQLATKEIPLSITLIKEFYQAFKNQWNTESKAFGFEVQAARIGGLIQRLQDVSQIIQDYASGKTAKIDELEITRLPFNCWKGATVDDINFNSWNINISTGVI